MFNVQYASIGLLNIAMYDDLLTQVTQYPDVVQVFTALQSASLQKHLPAFKRCSAE